MSGQRNKKPSDVIKNRQEYLDSLSLQVQLNEANEQAVKQFVATGQVPPISQMKDTRTTSDILLDVEKLKIGLIKDLEPIADPQFAQMIVSRLVQSPLNQDNRLIIFTAQRIEDIVKNLKKNYKYGIKGDANDAENFVLFINKFYTDRNKNIEGTKSFINRMGANSEIGASKQIEKQHSILSTTASEFNNWKFTNMQIIQNLYQLGGAPGHLIYPRVDAGEARMSGLLIIDITAKFRALLQILPKSLSIIQKMEQLSVQDVGTSGYNRANDAYKDFLNFINHNIPNTDYIETIILDLLESNKNLKTLLTQRNPQGFATLYNHQLGTLQKLNDILAVDLPDLARLEARSEIARTRADEIPYKPETMTQGPLSAGENQTIQDLLDRIGNNRMQMIINNGAIHPGGLPAIPGIAPIRPLNGALFNPEWAKLAPPAVITAKDIPQLTALHKKTFDYLKEYNIQGMGLNRKISGRGLPRADYTQGIDPSARYIKFGRYMINNKKLNDNVLSLRRSRGSTIATIPNNKMTSELSHVFKTIVGGGVPSYDDLNALTEAEKRYLHKVSQEADIYDKIKIPTPNKDEEEKDIHLFNVMKGEILAGNDSKELVSKFKKLLNKLSRTNVLPKSQVREILEELLELGY